MIDKLTINIQQIPVKAHYFFFMAALAPILPFVPVYGKQLGVSAAVLGIIAAILPILFFVSKPIFGFVADYFSNQRKTIFMFIIAFSFLPFVLLYFLPKQPGEPARFLNRVFNYSLLDFCNMHQICDMQSINVSCKRSCQEINYQAKIECLWDNYKILKKIISTSTIIKDNLNNQSSLICWDFVDQINQTSIENATMCNITADISDNNSVTCQIISIAINEAEQCLYKSIRFWGFVLLITIGTVFTHVTNSISDTICYDVLGEGHHTGYGRQRVWGALGYGLAAITTGYAIDLVSEDTVIKSYTPAFILTFVLAIIDIICCSKLELPILSASKNITKDVFNLLKNKNIRIFAIYAVLSGAINGFIFCFMFWYLEDIAIQTNHTHQMKLIEGLIIVAQALGCELIFFPLTGKIIKKFGYGYSFAFSFLSYAIRLALLSSVPNPWWVIIVDLIMHGSSFSLSYTIISGYASVIAPPGTSATVQGIVGGMNDGLGIAIGSFIGGILYKKMGGQLTIRIFSGISFIASVSYFLFYITILKYEMLKVVTDKRRSKNHNNIIWKDPQVAIDDCDTADDVVMP